MINPGWLSHHQLHLLMSLSHQDSFQIVQSHQIDLPQHCSSCHKKMVMPEDSASEDNRATSSMEVERSVDKTGRMVGIRD